MAPLKIHRQNWGERIGAWIDAQTQVSFITQIAVSPFGAESRKWSQSPLPPQKKVWSQALFCSENMAGLHGFPSLAKQSLE